MNSEYCNRHNITYSPPGHCPKCFEEDFGPYVEPTVSVKYDTPVDVRGATHGHFSLVSKVAQQIKEATRWGPADLNTNQREALDLIATKMARIVCGDPNFADHWVDIQGYAQLGNTGK